MQEPIGGGFAAVPVALQECSLARAEWEPWHMSVLLMSQRIAVGFPKLSASLLQSYLSHPVRPDPQHSDLVCSQHLE